MNKKIAEIRIDLYQKGLRARCEDLDIDTFCNDGNEVMEFLNEVQGLTDPDVRYTITDVGREYLKSLEEKQEEEENDTSTK